MNEESDTTQPAKRFIPPPIQPGEVRNPEGHNQYTNLEGKRLSDLLRKRMTERKVADKLLDRLIDLMDYTVTIGSGGNQREVLSKDALGAIKEIFDRLDGKPKQSVDVTSGGEKIKGYCTVSPSDWTAIVAGKSNGNDNLPIPPVPETDKPVA